MYLLAQKNNYLLSHHNFAFLEILWFFILWLIFIVNYSRTVFAVTFSILQSSTLLMLKYPKNVTVVCFFLIWDF